MNGDAEYTLAQVLAYAERLLNEAFNSQAKCTGSDCGVCTQGNISQQILNIAEENGYTKR